MCRLPSFPCRSGLSALAADGVATSSTDIASTDRPSLVGPSAELLIYLYLLYKKSKYGKPLRPTWHKTVLSGDVVRKHQNSSPNPVDKSSRNRFSFYSKNSLRPLIGSLLAQTSAYSSLKMAMGGLISWASRDISMTGPVMMADPLHKCACRLRGSHVLLAFMSMTALILGRDLLSLPIALTLIRTPIQAACANLSYHPFEVCLCLPGWHCVRNHWLDCTCPGNSLKTRSLAPTRTMNPISSFRLPTCLAKVHFEITSCTRISIPYLTSSVICQLDFTCTGSPSVAKLACAHLTGTSFRVAWDRPFRAHMYSPGHRCIYPTHGVEFTYRTGLSCHRTHSLWQPALSCTRPVYNPTLARPSRTPTRVPLLSGSPALQPCTTVE